jgi:hypothetical protein
MLAGQGEDSVGASSSRPKSSSSDSRPPRGAGIRFSTLSTDVRVRASVLIDAQADPVVVLNTAVLGTLLEIAALDWAAGVIGAGEHGFYVWVDRPDHLT